MRSSVLTKFRATISNMKILKTELHLKVLYFAMYKAHFFDQISEGKLYEYI